MANQFFDQFFRPLNGIQWLTLMLVAVVAGGFIFGFSRLENVQHHQNDALHSIICFVEKRELANPHLTWTEKHQAVSFWKQALSNAHLSACRGEK